MVNSLLKSFLWDLGQYKGPRQWRRQVVIFCLTIILPWSNNVALGLPQSGSTRTDKIISGNLDDIWNATVSILAQEGIPIDAIEKDSGVINTTVFEYVRGLNANKVMDQYVQLPSIMFCIWTIGRCRLNIHISDLGNERSRVIINPNFESYEENVTYSWHPCPSKGVFEAKLLEHIENEVAIVRSKKIVKDTHEEKTDTITQLERLAKLRDDGILTEEEFQAQKDKLLK